MLLNTTSIMLTLIVLNLHHRNDHNKPVPRIVQRLILGALARLLRMSTRYNKRQRQQQRASCMSAHNGSFRRSPSQHKFRSKARSRVAGDVTGYCLCAAAGSVISAHVPRQENNTSDAHLPAYRTNDVTVGETQNKTDCGSTGIQNNLQRERCVHNNSFRDRAMESCLEDWRDLARIMDRLFFWVSLFAMIAFCVVILVIVWT